MGTSVQ